MQCTTSRNWCGRRHKFRHTCAQRTHGNPHLRTCPPRWCRGLSSGRAASRCGPRLRSWFLPTCPHTVSSYRHHPRPQHKHMCRRRGIAAATRAQAPAPVPQLQVSGHDICRFFTSGAIPCSAASGNRWPLERNLQQAFLVRAALVAGLSKIALQQSQLSMRAGRAPRPTAAAAPAQEGRTLLPDLLSLSLKKENTRFSRLHGGLCIHRRRGSPPHTGHSATSLSPTLRPHKTFHLARRGRCRCPSGRGTKAVSGGGACWVVMPDKARRQNGQHEKVWFLSCGAIPVLLLLPVYDAPGLSCRVPVCSAGDAGEKHKSWRIAVGRQCARGGQADAGGGAATSWRVRAHTACVH